jgi:hypothetical protein
LGAGQRIGQVFDEALDQPGSNPVVVAGVMCDALRRRLEFALVAHERDLDAQQFVEHEAVAGRHHLPHGGGIVDGS